MRTANILIRAGGQREGGAASIVRAAGMEAWLRDVWPAARVSVFAEGDREMQDWLYLRVRDLVPIRPESRGVDEAWTRETRGPADLVIWDGCVFNEERRRIWLRGARHLVVRTDPLSTDAEGEPVAGWLWAGPDVASTPPEIVTGWESALLDPTLANLAAARRPAGSPVQEVVVVMAPSCDPEAERWLAAEVGALVAAGISLTIVASTGAPRAHLAELGDRLPTARIEVGPMRLPELLGRADLAVLAGGANALEAAVLGTPAVIVGFSQDDAGPASRLAATGAATFLGVRGNLRPGDFERAIGQLIESPAELRLLVSRGQSLLDASGLHRLLVRLLPDGLLAKPPAAVGVHRGLVAPLSAR